MIGHLGHILVGLADNIMVGRLGAAPLAAVSLGNSFIFIALSLGIGFSMAITPLIAEADSEGDIEKGRKYFQQSLILSTVIGVVMFLMIIFAVPILQYMDQPPEVVILAVPYLKIVAFSLVPLMIFQGIKQFTDGLSQTKYGMYATVFANIINVVLNFLLIYGFWIFPRLELEGAAWGTLISRFSMLFLRIFIIRSRDKFIPYFQRIRLNEIRRKVFKKIINLGFPSAMQMLFESGIFIAAVWLSGTIGTIDQAANQIALNLSALTFMIPLGLGVTATIRVANQKGLKNFVDLRRKRNHWIHCFLIGYLV